MDVAIFCFAELFLYIVETCYCRNERGIESSMQNTATFVERGSSAVACRTRNQVSPGSNPPLLAFRRLGIFVLSIDATVHSAV